MKDLTGARLGNYDVKERLGAGGMAVVCRAVQQPLGREVVLRERPPFRLDEVLGELSNASRRQIDPDRGRTIHYQNPSALGHSRPDKACHFWISSYEARLRWAGLANDWLVEEIECGSDTGTADSVFALRSVKT